MRWATPVPKILMGYPVVTHLFLALPSHGRPIRGIKDAAVMGR